MLDFIIIAMESHWKGQLTECDFRRIVPATLCEHRLWNESGQVEPPDLD